MASNASGGSSRYESPISYTTRRALAMIELLAFSPGTAPQLAAAVGVHPRTARRTLKTLAADEYVERSAGPRGVYRPTTRLLALAAQLAERLPLVVCGRRAVADLAERTGVGVVLAMPSYRDVLVLASAGREVARPGTLVRAHESAAGRALLAQRTRWRESLGLSPDEIGVQPALGVAALVGPQADPVAAISLTGQAGGQHVAALTDAARALTASIE